MLQTIPAILWITFLSWNYGFFFIILCRRVTAGHDHALPPAGIVCLAGLSVLVTGASWLSLFLPLGSPAVQVILLAPVLTALLASPSLRRTLLEHWGQAARILQPEGWMLFTAACLLITVMGSWLITHPDTLGYHAQTIRWLQAYRVIPGLAHLHVRYGYQGNWYLLCALFGFPFTGTPALTFVNLALACWYVFFVTGEICRPVTLRNLSGQSAIRSTLFLLLLAITFFDFGQLRLMVASASPDFPAALWVLAALFVFADPARCGGEKVSLYLAALLAMVAVTIKVSSLPLLLLSAAVLYRLARLKMFKSVLLLLLTGFLVFSPFFARNVITSGYAVFPSVVPDLFSPAWKYDRTRTIEEKRYIAAYAKVGDAVNRGDVDPEYLKSVKGWLPTWWKNKSVAEKEMLTMLALSLLCTLFFRRRVFGQASPNTRVCLAVALAGLLFWWVQAPDPRFAYGFILGTTGLVLYQLAAAFPVSHGDISRQLMRGCLLLAVCLGAYTAYRLTHFFTPANLLRPSGVYTPGFTTVRYQNLLLHVPKEGVPCGGTPLPCAEDKPHFKRRGPNVEDGFTDTP